jgi:NADPH:quinone reductase-like Zn-dependent oxidoreductase
MGSGSRRGWAQLAPEWTLTINTIWIGRLGIPHEGREMTILADRVALVTGASSGIGAGLAAMLAAEGARVVLAARRGGELERVAAAICRAGGVAVPVVTDLADDDSMARLLVRTAADLGPVDVLVNNAGFGLWKPLEETSIAERRLHVRGQRAGRRLPVRGGAAWHAGTPLRPRDQHRQRAGWRSCRAWPPTASASTPWSR